MIIPFAESTVLSSELGSAVFARDVLGADFVEIVDSQGGPSAQMHLESCLKEAQALHFYAAFIEALPRWSAVGER